MTKKRPTDRLPLSREERTALDRGLGARVTATLEREITEALSRVQDPSLAEIRRAERRVLLAARSLRKALTYRAYVTAHALPKGLLPTLGSLIEYLKGSSRAKRARPARRDQAVWERRAVEQAFLRVLRKRKVPDNDAVAAQALAAVLRAALGVKISDLDPANQRKALHRARHELDRQEKVRRDGEELLGAGGRSPR